MFSKSTPEQCVNVGVEASSQAAFDARSSSPCQLVGSLVPSSLEDKSPGPDLKAAAQQAARGEGLIKAVRAMATDPARHSQDMGGQEASPSNGSSQR